MALAGFGTSCRRAAAPAPSTPGNAAVTSRAQASVPIGPTNRVRLDSLPYGARFRWADPSSVFTGLSERDVELAMGFEAHEQRRFFVAVLDANGWRAVPDSAEYELVAAKSTRSWTHSVTTPDPRNAEQVDPCAGQLPQQCRPPRRIVYPPRVTRETVTEVRQLFAVVRLRDGATRWWIVLGANPGDVPIALLQMLRNGQEH